MAIAPSSGRCCAATSPWRSSGERRRSAGRNGVASKVRPVSAALRTNAGCGRFRSAGSVRQFWELAVFHRRAGSAELITCGARQRHGKDEVQGAVHQVDRHAGGAAQVAQRLVCRMQDAAQRGQGAVDVRMGETVEQREGRAVGESREQDAIVCHAVPAIEPRDRLQDAGVFRLAPGRAQAAGSDEQVAQAFGFAHPVPQKVPAGARRAVQSHDDRPGMIGGVGFRHIHGESAVMPFRLDVHHACGRRCGLCRRRRVGN